LLVGFSIGAAEAKRCILPDFDVNNFTTPQSNLYLPIPGAGGTTYVYEAETEDEFILNIIYISTDIHPILGVVCIVVYDTEWVYIENLDQWFMTETTEDWHAWDNAGNFWYFGEWTTAYEYDENWNCLGFDHDGSWEADGVDVWPGIIVPSNPRPGTCYQQEYLEGEAEDRGKVLRLSEGVRQMSCGVLSSIVRTPGMSDPGG
jgi:hypothetical protein